MDKAARKKDRAEQKRTSPGLPPGTVEEYESALPDDMDGPPAGPTNEARPSTP